MYTTLPTGAKVIFVHIPKTGGTSFGRALASEYAHDIRFLNGGARCALEEIRTTPPEALARFRAYSGHLAFGLHESLPFPASYVTFLRDPTERLVSHYHHILGEPGHYLHETIIGRSMSLLDYVSSDLTVELDNHQARMIAGIDVEQRPIDSCDISTLHLARSNLERHFAAVGVQERFDDSLRLIRETLGWTGDTFYTAERVHDSRPRGREIDPEVARVVESRNWIDLVLHREAMDLVRREIDARLEPRAISFQRERRLPVTTRPPVGRGILTRFRETFARAQ